MPARMIKGLVLLVSVIGIVLYIYSLNPSPVVVNYKWGSSWEGPLALVLILAMGLGAFAMFLVALLLGLKFQLHQRRLNKQNDLLRAHYDQITKAKEFIALGEYETAQSILNRVVEKDPANVNARILLAEAYRKDGDKTNALKILEQTRAEHKHNAELLLATSDLYSTLGNHTAAFDNAIMVLKHAPKSENTLERLVRDAKSLARWEQAIDFQSKLVRLASGEDQVARQNELASLELHFALESKGQDTAAAKVAIAELLKRHRDYAPALAVLAEFERDSLDLKAASAQWKRAFQAEANPIYLEALAKMWLDADQPQKAIEQVRSAIAPKQRQGQPERLGQLFLVKLLLHLEHVEEARREYDLLRNLAAGDSSFRHQLSILSAKFHAKAGDLELAITELLQVVETVGPFPDSELFPTLRNSRPAIDWKGRVKQLSDNHEPSPILSQS